MQCIPPEDQFDTTPLRPPPRDNIYIYIYTHTYTYVYAHVYAHDFSKILHIIARSSRLHRSYLALAYHCLLGLSRLLLYLLRDCLFQRDA